MAAVFGCDGCDFSTKNKDDLHTVGRIHPRQYCADCRPVATEFLDRAHEIHRQAVLFMDKELAAIKAEFGSRLEELPLAGDV